MCPGHEINVLGGKMGQSFLHKCSAVTLLVRALGLVPALLGWVLGH